MSTGRNGALSVLRTVAGVSSEGLKDEQGPQYVRRPMVSAAFGFCFGILAAPADALFADALVCVALSVAVFQLARAQRVLGALLLPAPFFFAGLVAGSLALPPRIDADPPSGTVIVEGVVAEAPTFAPRGARLLVDMTATSTAWGAPLRPSAGRVSLTIYGDGPDCGAPGDTIRAWARLAVPEPAVLPGRTSQRMLAARRGIDMYGRVSKPGHCTKVGEAAHPSIERVRARVAQAIGRALPAEQAAIVRVFAIGDRSALSEATREDFRASGLSHLMAISGLHLAVFVGLIAAALAFFFSFSSRITLGIGVQRFAAIFALPTIVLYTLMTGASPSALRAAIMIGALMVAFISRRVTEPWSALALALLVMLAFDPTGIGDVSFQLSFAAVAALLRLYPALRNKLAPKLSTWVAPLRWPVEIALASAAATIGTIPLVARHFSRVSLAGLVANVPATPLASLVLVPLSLVGGLLGTISDTLAQPVLQVAGWSASCLAAVASTAASLPLASIYVPRPTVVECVLFYGATIALSVVPSTRAKRRFGYACAAGLVILFTALQITRSASSDLRVAFLPVGQGDSALVEIPGGDVMVIDAGPEDERVIAPYLRSRRITSIDIFVITHPHADHAGGLATLARQFPIREVWWNGDRDAAAPELLALLDEMTTRVITASTAPQRVGRDGAVLIEPLGPGVSEVIGSERSNVNDRSVVLRIVYGARSVLLTGDAESSAETALVRRGGLKSDVLKLGHHGSRSSSTQPFIDAVDPAFAVISAGRNNKFGFPHDEVMQRLGAGQITSYSTAENGLVVVQTDGESLRVTPLR